MAKSQAEKRAPIVSILGHIDHGKSSLLDYIRKSNVVAKEAGGITQHISAYEITRPDGRKITFLDTPGHEAFANVRTRGASAADIAILIVSGEDGVKPQTLEVYKKIQDIKLPFIVAITKIDKPNADVDRTKQTLAEAGIYVEGYGGDVPFVALSAKTGQGVDDLLDTIGLMADVLEIQGDSDTLAQGIVIESRMDPKRGITTVVVIKNGTLSKSTFVASGKAWAPVRFIINSNGQNVDEATMGSPAQITGWDQMPEVGGEFKTFLKKDEALKYVEKFETPDHKPEAKTQESGTILPLIVKADTAGSLEAIKNQISKLSRERIAPKIILSDVGSINDGDIKFATTTPGTQIIGFNTKIDNTAKILAERSNVTINLFEIIYELTEKIESLLAQHEPRIEVEEILGTAKILKVFSATKNKQVAGGRVLTGKITLNAQVKIMRREVEIGRGRIKELQQSRVNTNEVLEGTEFGLMIESKLEVAPGDVLEAIITVTK